MIDLSNLVEVNRSPKTDNKSAYYSRAGYARFSAPAVVRFCLRGEDVKTVAVYASTPELVEAVKTNEDFSENGAVKGLGDALGHGKGGSLGLYKTKKSVWVACRENAALALQALVSEDDVVASLAEDIGLGSTDELVTKVNSLPSFEQRTGVALSAT